MDREYIDSTEVAKLMRKVLKECWPETKFSVRTSKYAGGSSIYVGWEDGPSGEKVSELTLLFNGSYFDGMTDYQGSRFHSLDGKPVRLLSDYVFTKRDYSDSFMAKAQEVFEAQGGEKGPKGLSKICHELEVNGFPPMANSPTLARLSFEGDDGYSQSLMKHIESKIQPPPSQDDSQDCMNLLKKEKPKLSLVKNSLH